MDLRMVGYWWSEDASAYPDPKVLVDPGWDMEERVLVETYLHDGQVARQFMGASRCRICGQANGGDERTDGTYIWPSGLGHYVIEHAVRLPREFVEHVLRRAQEIEDARIDVTWWKAHAYDD
ncbi:hypothetical protein [Yinghuangia seranimata]|uniref:hypothetical protein n=1 Tax=Yinghuangia seranimata TaxID=408067 RepID=UPI00248BEA02|nr:hypothetical protein [Yinghuangia seranimata]MDI2126793.1 hypothetical protein [Yinghuangia seranimata]